MSAPQQRTPAGLAADLVVVPALLGVGLVGFAGVFTGSGWPVAAGVGLVLGLAVAVAGARWRWPAVLQVAVLVLGYVLVAGPVVAPTVTTARVVPTPASLRAVVETAVHAWKDVLTLPLPAGDQTSLLTVVLLTAAVLTWWAAAVTLRARRAAWALPAVALAFVVPVALGGPDTVAPVLRGVGLTVVATGWAVWRHGVPRVEVLDGPDAPGGRRALVASRVRGGALMLLAAGGIAVVVAPATAAFDARHTLRESVVPPLRLEDYRSPLTGFRGYVKDHADDVLLTVAGLPAGARLRLATLDGYDGVVYDVAGSGQATFEHLSGGGATGTVTHVDVEVGTYAGVWVPGAGDVRAVRYAGPRADELARSTFHDAGSGTVITTAGLTTGDRYALDVVLPTVHADASLVGHAFDAVALPTPTGVPDVVSTVASELAAGGSGPSAARSLQAALSGQGYFSHGLAGETTSRAGHTAERIATLLGAEQMVGDDEQYAVAMALMARQLGMPARVVMGFYPAHVTHGPVQLTGSDVHAWVEIAYQGVGWVPYDPTPAQDRTVTEETPQPRSQPRPQPLQPPEPVDKPAELPPDSRQEESDDQEAEQTASGAGHVLAIVVTVAVPLVLLGGPLLVVALAKSRRARRRARAATTAARVSGGWHEVVDHAIDLGATVPAGVTRRETVTLLAPTFPAADIETLAARADASVFGAGEPSDEDVRTLWALVDQARGAMSGSVGLRRRVVARFSSRSLRAQRARRRADAARTERPAPPARRAREEHRP